MWCNGCKNFILTNLKGLQQKLNAIFGAVFGGGVILGKFGDKKICRGADLGG
uniref:SCO PROTEIN HOMEOSTASIS, CHAPERONE, HOMEOSTASIS.4A n=1 Tax=Myoviridae sp. ctwSu1 TaxID=2825207 RepID=A0A8S5U1A7_9CAUD|nr:MAG TPA: SCO PROTEIN HOMEOSTASIS, CHAPERONE, HOMEOSTASIS.4A [Myoviridae sp. ctwSu1]